MRKTVGLILFVLIVSLTFVASAVVFSDVNNERWSWAKPSIEEMNEKGVIKGFPDGTFKPDQSVTKLQGIILIARLWGIDLEENAEYVRLAEEANTGALLAYSASNKREIAYLLYKGVLDKSELNDYILSDNANRALKRYEAAILLAKALGKESEVKNSVISILPYKDTSDIPMLARAYVKTVKEENIMGGMTETEFGPMVDVSRAQIATMLYRIMKKNEKEESRSIGTAVAIDLDKGTITVKSAIDVINTYELDDSVLVRLDGVIAKLSDYTIGTQVRITLKSDKPYMLEGILPETTDAVSGAVLSISSSGSPKKIKIRVTEKNETVTKEYIISDDAEVIYANKKSSLSSINVSDSVLLSIKKNKVVSLVAENKSRDVEGVVNEIILEPTISLKLKLEDGNMGEFEVLSEATVRKNNATSDLRNIFVGDKVKLSLEYNKVKKISAESVTKTDEGLIEEVIISATPSIKIRNQNELYKYIISRNVEVKIDGKSTLNDKPIEIYNLRLNYNVKLTLDNDVVVKIEAQALGQAQQMTGTVELVSESYKSIRIAVIDAVTRQATSQHVFVKNGASIINSSSSKSKLLSLGDIKSGNVVTVIGTADSGIFEASTIVIISN